MRRADVTLTLLPRAYQNPSSTQNVEERVAREAKRERALKEIMAKVRLLCKALRFLVRQLFRN